MILRLYRTGVVVRGGGFLVSEAGLAWLVCVHTLREGTCGSCVLILQIPIHQLLEASR